jgi:hypothetical protein
LKLAKLHIDIWHFSVVARAPDCLASSVGGHQQTKPLRETQLVRGKSILVQKLANALIATKGVKHGRFMLTTSGRDSAVR